MRGWDLSCNIIESVLLSKGYKVYNASPSLPADSVINSLDNIFPDAILISITLTDHIQTTRNLNRKIRARFPSLTIFIGRIAINDPNKTYDFSTTSLYVIRNMMLADAIKLIRSTIVRIRTMWLMRYTGTEFFNGSGTQRGYYSYILIRLFSNVGNPPISSQISDDMSTDKPMLLTFRTNCSKHPSPR